MSGVSAIQPELHLLGPAPELEAGVVYTRPWAVDLILDLAGFSPEKPLGSMLAVEPSVGDGAFLKAMIRRLYDSCKQHGTNIENARKSVVAFEINPEAAMKARESARAELVSLGVPVKSANELANDWIRTDDFLLAAPKLKNVDFVIGNPPYIRLEAVPADRASVYRSTYSTMRGRADIYVAFYEAALATLGEGGICAYICADRWLRNEYGAELRKLISSQYAVKFIIETHDVDAFERDVSAYPAITIIAKEKQASAIVAKALPGIEKAAREHVIDQIRSAKSNAVIQAASFSRWFKGEEPWPCSSPQDLCILQDLESRFALLESAETKTCVGIGVATGADKVFIVEDRIEVEEDRLLPLAMQWDLAEPAVSWSGHYLVNPWNDLGLVDLSRYPKLETHFQAHRQQLASRHVAKKESRKWYRTIDRVNYGLLSKPKLYIADIRNRLLPSLDNGKTYPHHNVYWITSEVWDLRVLGAILMSGVGDFFIRSYGVKMRGGYFRFQAQYLRRIRVPNPKAVPKEATDNLIKSWNNRDVQLATEVCLKLYGIKSLPKAS